MQRISAYFINRTIQQKMMSIMLFVLGLTVAVLSFSNVNVLNRSFSQITNEQTLEMANQVSLRIESFINETEHLLDYISDDEVFDEFGTVPADQEDIERIEEVLKRYAGVNNEIAGILVVDKQGLAMSESIEVIEDRPLILENWYIETAADPDVTHVFYQMIGRNISSYYDSYKPDNVISVTKALTDSQGKVTGVILVDMKLDTITSIINSANLSKGGFLYIANTDGDVVYGPVNNVLYRIHETMLLKDQFVEVEGRTYQIIQREAGISNWKVIGVFPQDLTMRIILEVIAYFILFAILLFLFATVLLDVLVKFVTKPISELKKLMRKAEEGNLEVRYESDYNDEISELGGSFNTMIESIDKLMKMVYTEQRAKRKAEIDAFQAQIKPHFLYNTLDTINWMAMDHEADEIADLVQDLTNLFRISLSKGNEIITLENEMLHVSSYLSIQKVRYEDQFDYKIHWDKKYKNLRVIKLIIQPIVENAIYHGIKGSTTTELLDISVEVQEPYLIITVKDTGHGMDEKQVRYLNRVFNKEETKKETTGIGLVNVNERIKLNFGDEYGLSITSEANKGTTVVVKHPIIEK